MKIQTAIVASPHRGAIHNKNVVASFRNGASIFFLLFFDSVALYLSFLIVESLGTNSQLLNSYADIEYLIVRTLSVLIILLFASQGLYTKRRTFWDEVKKILKVVLFVQLLMIPMVISLNGMISGSQVVFIGQFGVVGMCMLIVFRVFGKKILHAMGMGFERVVVVGAGQAGVNVVKGLHKDGYLGYKVIGFLDDDIEKKGKTIQGLKVFGGVKNITRFISKLEIETVVIAMPSLPVDSLAELTNKIQKFVKKIIVVPEVKGIPLLNTELYSLFMEQLFLLEVKNNLKTPFTMLMKEVFDILLALLLFPFVALIVAILGILIKLDSPGPVFYSHARVGQHGRTIMVYKFRSMYKDSEERLKKILETDENARKEWETCFKLKNDPRITRVGSFLRKTSLDELPQIFNVLKREMSLVGPRPVLKKEIEEYYKEYADYYFLVKPGMSGLWQVSGRSNTDYDFRVKLDAWYVLNWSLWLDIILLAKTVKVVLNREGAY